MCLRVDGPGTGQTRLLLRRQGDIDFSGDALRHFALEGQDVTQVALVALRPQGLLGGGPDQSGRDSHLVARAHNRTFDDRVDIQFPRDGSGAACAPSCTASPRCARSLAASRSRTDPRSTARSSRRQNTPAPDHRTGSPVAARRPIESASSPSSWIAGCSLFTATAAITAAARRPAHPKATRGRSTLEDRTTATGADAAASSAARTSPAAWYRCPGSLARHRWTMPRSVGGTRAAMAPAAPSKSPTQTPSALGPRTAMTRSPSREESLRAPRCLRAHRQVCRPELQEPCNRGCPSPLRAE